MSTAVTLDFYRRVAGESSEPIARCYQCQKCSGGCPVSFAMDLRPHEVIRLVQLGRDEEVLKSQAIWICIGCKTCQARCPNDIDASRVMDGLRALARERGYRPGDERVAAFHEAFLRTVQGLGRAYELGTVALFKARTRDLFGDLTLGLEMFRRGKLKIRPSRIRRRAEIGRIFRLAKGKRP